MATESNILSFTPANWLTVTLMGLLGFAFVGMVVKVINERKANGG